MLTNKPLSWRARDEVDEPLELIINRLDCSPLLARLLAIRGFQDPARAQSFLNPDESQFHNPYDLARGEPAAEQILNSVRNGDLIRLVGEHSIDGQIGTALLYRLVHQMNGDVEYCIVDENGPSKEFQTDTDDVLTIFVGRPPGYRDYLPSGSNSDQQAVMLGRKISENETEDNLIVVDPLGKASRYLNHSVPITGIALKVGEIVLRKKYGEEPPNFVAVDLETTGTTASQDEIIEIGAVRFRRGNPVDEFQTFVSSVEEVPDVIEELTGLTAPDLQGAPDPPRALQDFIDFLNGEVLVAHNAPFDAGFLHFSMKKYLDQSFLNDYDDSKELARTILTDLPEHSLKQVCHRLGVDMGTHHRALDDAYSCGEIYVQLRSSNPGPIKNFRRRYLPFVALSIMAGQTPLSPENRAMTQIGLNCLDRSPFEGFAYLNRRMQDVASDSFGLYRGPLSIIRLAARRNDGEFLVELLGKPDVDGDIFDRLDELTIDWRKQKIESKQSLVESFERNANPEHRLNILPVERIDRYLMDGEIAKLSNDLNRSFMVVAPTDDDRYEALLRTSETVDLDIILSNLNPDESLRDEGACSARFMFSTDDLDRLENEINNQLGETDDPVFQADYDVELNEADLETLSIGELSGMGPFGSGNSRPRFLLRGVSIVDVTPEGPHSIDLRLGVEKDGVGFEAIAPEMGYFDRGVESGRVMDIIVEMVQEERPKQGPDTQILIVDLWNTGRSDDSER